MPAIQNPKSVPELVKLLAKHGKRSLLVSGVDVTGERAAVGKVVIDLANIEPLHETDAKKDRIRIGTGMTLGGLARERAGENGLLQRAASMIGNPLVRNKITF